RTRLLRRERQAREEAEAIRDLVAAVATVPDYQQAMQTLAHWARKATGAKLVFISTVERDFIQPHVRSGDDQGYMEFYMTKPPPLTSQTPVARALRTNAVYICADTATDEALPFRQALLEHGLRTIVVVPVCYQTQPLGAVVAYGPRPNFFAQGQVELLATAAGLAAPVLDARHRQMQEQERHRETIHMLAGAVEAKDDSTGRHLQQIYRLSRALALQVGLTTTEAEALATAAILHDIGKIRLPESILCNPGRLNDQEWVEMRKHPIYGDEILANSPDFALECETIRWHHERWDGSGYPDGLQGEEIPLAARIVAVADAFDAMTSERPYKAAWPPERAIAEIVALRGIHYDPRVVDALLSLQEEVITGRTLEGERG
ncbi:MAG: HD domain-containing phosphohydrolase, partial [Dehalococcoidia bacterium]